MKTILNLIMALACVIPAMADDDAVLKQRVAGLARKVSMDGFNNSEKGIIGDARVSKPQKNPSRNKGAEPFLWVQEANHVAVIRSTTGARQGTITDSTGQHLGLKDTSTSLILWSGKAWRIGWLQFISREGFARKLPLYTASEAEALAFYKEHGFTQAAADHVVHHRK
jgi:hypothetical protein